MPARFIQQSAIFIPQTRLNSSLSLGERRSNWLWLLQWLNNNTTPHWLSLQPASSPAVASLASMLRTVQSNRDSDSGHRRGTLCSPCPRWRCPAWSRQWNGQSYVSQSHAHTHKRAGRGRGGRAGRDWNVVKQFAPCSLAGSYEGYAHQREHLTRHIPSTFCWKYKLHSLNL